MSQPTRKPDAASNLSGELKGALRQVSFGAKVEPKGGKNPKGGITKEVGALVYALSDLDSWYSILMSSLVAFLLNRSNYFLKPQGSGFIREFLTFTLFELLQPKLSSIIPRFGVHDIDTHRYRVGPAGSIQANPRLTYAAGSTEIGEQWDWELTFKEWANALPVILVCMVIVDVGLGKRSDLRSLLHYMFVMLVVSGSRFFKNQVLVNNHGRQSGVEIFRRAMALGWSFETVPKITFKPKVPARKMTPEAAEAQYKERHP